MADIQLTPHQKESFDKIISALSDCTTDVIIMKGYAGTGKTTLLSFIYKYITDTMKKPCQVMAPTGRAAKVLRDKVGIGATIHKSIYSKEMNLIDSGSGEVSKKSFRCIFHVKRSYDPADAIICDESSMISNMGGDTEILKFGSGRLLDDLLEYATISSIKKLIFVGDNAQLPPVGDNRSSALDEEFFRGRGYNVVTTQLTEVVRQAGESAILEEATAMRELLKQPLKERKSFVLHDNGKDILKERASRIPELYTNLFPSPDTGESVVLSFSNRQCLYMNKAIRQYLYPGVKEICVGDILLIGSNNYGSFGRDIFNGDMAKVTAIGQRRYTTIKVWHNGLSEIVPLHFLEVTLLFPDDNGLYNCVILESMLESPERDLDIFEQKALYIDFCIRMTAMGVREKSQEFRMELAMDPYFNALKVKWGYAITTHKAQGGEWKTVFVDYSGRTGLSDDNIRWCYTATTRAKETLYIVNPPNITFNSSLTFSHIINISKAPKEFWGDLPDLDCPFYNSGTPIPLKMKCLGIMEALEGTQYSIKNIESFNYRERYTFTNGDEDFKMDALYNGAYLFSHLPLTGDNSPSDKLRALFNESYHLPDFHFDFSDYPDKESLLQRVNAAATEAGMTITNVVDNITQSYMMFCFLAPESYSVIKFYFSKGRLSTAMPQSSLGENDERLKTLIRLMS